MSSERKAKIVSAIFLLVIISVMLKTLEYFGYESEPDRTRGLEYRQERVKQLHSDQLTEQIVHETLRSR